MFKTGVSFGVLSGVFLTILVAFAPRYVGRGPEEAYSSSAQLEATRASAEFVPDGDLTKPQWKRAKWVEVAIRDKFRRSARSEEHTAERQSLTKLVCRLLL